MGKVKEYIRKMTGPILGSEGLRWDEELGDGGEEEVHTGSK